jgi:hypothetical protein
MSAATESGVNFSFEAEVGRKQQTKRARAALTAVLGGVLAVALLAAVNQPPSSPQKPTSFPRAGPRFGPTAQFSPHSMPPHQAACCCMESALARGVGLGDGRGRRHAGLGILHVTAAREILPICIHIMRKSLTRNPAGGCPEHWRFCQAR